ncbi:FecR family protein [Pedobacter endophyticus]|uniref:DUF4974 domain-containing protein n=1 Tax=Pedobacter endophyticus TaxID=2789740 RepID=A0A7S9KZI1_9SPHI|nr:FecR domain-containing protein [Pedobacter endophyticus]QPH39714.1 DUF4974 domain-containing protein [Pedobacter endophyticus]
MKEKRLKYLFNKCFQNLATPEEQEEFMALVEDIANKDLVEQEMENYWNNFEPVEKPFFEADKEAMWFEIMQHGAVRKYKLWPRIAGVAASVIAIFLAAYFLKNDGKTELKEVQNDVAYKNDIAPGKNAATLILNTQGKTISLSDGNGGLIIKDDKLVYNDGSLIADLPPAESGQTANRKSDEQTIITPRGGTYQVTLSDGTKVWLNSDSRLTYSPRLNQQAVRRVKLEGEGYFEVAKDKKRPFIVSSKGQEVRVLGTHFNVNSYVDEVSVKTTLLEGSVRVSFRSGEAKAHNVILKPNQQSILSSSDITKKQVNAEAAVAWKTGNFRFENQNIRDIMKQVARWYNVEVVYKDELPGVRLNASVSRNRNISQLLKMMEQTNEVHFKIEGRRIIVLK